MRGIHQNADDFDFFQSFNSFFLFSFNTIEKKEKETRIQKESGKQETRKERKGGQERAREEGTCVLHLAVMWVVHRKFVLLPVRKNWSDCLFKNIEKVWIK